MKNKGCAGWLVLLVIVALFVAYENKIIAIPISKQATAQPTAWVTVAPTVFPPPVDYPENGHLYIKPTKEGMNTITVKTTGDEAYLVKLADTGSGETVRFFVTPGSTATINIPEGTYELSYAAGKTWYGLKYLFGSDTICSKFDDLLPFTVKVEGLSRYYTTYEVTFYGVTDGNATTQYISMEEFLK